MPLDSVSRIGAVRVVSSAETSAATEVAASDTVAVMVTVSPFAAVAGEASTVTVGAVVSTVRDPAGALGPLGLRLTVIACTPSRKLATDTLPV